MAILRGPGSMLSSYHRAEIPKFTANWIQWSMDARRATIFFRRVKNAGEDPDVKIFGTHSPNTSDHSEITPAREDLIQTRESLGSFGENSPNTSDHSNFAFNQNQEKLEDFVCIRDLDSQGYDQGYEDIMLPFIPRELEYHSESTFVGIKPMGRNNPLYQYVGAEDRLDFEIDWYAFDHGRRDVIEKCRKIESLSKADGYNRGPHRVQLIWGKGNVLFSEHKFIVLAAPYRLSHFNKGYLNSSAGVTSTHLLPVQAYQRISLGRITSKNLEKVDIEYVKEV